MINDSISYQGRERGPGIMTVETSGIPPVLSSATLDRLRADPLRSWSHIFEHEGVADEMQKLFGHEDQTLIRPVYEVALNEKKIIAGSIMIYAHILKIDPLVARRLAAIGQFSWGVIKAYDNILDGSLKRNGSPTHLVKEGLAKSLRSSVSALLAVQKETMMDSNFSLDFLGMADDSMAADTAMSEFTWDTPLAEYIPVMKQMNKAFSWFPEVLGKLSGQDKAGKAFSDFQANLLCLVQINNYIKNLILPVSDDEPGSDLAINISPVLNTLRRFFTRSKTFDRERKFIERIVAAERKNAFLNREGMPDNSKRMKDIMAVLKIWNEHRVTAHLALAPHAESIYSAASNSLDNGFASLTFPLNKNIDENSTVKNFLRENLQAVYKQFYTTMFSEN